MRLTLYTRAWCHLCEDMAGALAPLGRELGFDLDEADVDADPALEARFGERVPVLVAPDGTEICHYHLDIGALRRCIAAARGGGLS